MPEDRKTVEEKTARLQSVTEKVQQFLNGGGDLKSPESVPLGLEFIHAYDDLAKEFGYQVLERAVNKVEAKETALVKLFTFEKKRELGKVLSGSCY